MITHRGAGLLLALLLTAGNVCAQDSSSTSLEDVLEDVEQIYSFRQVANIIWVERKDKISFKETGEDQSFLELMTSEWILAGLAAQVKFNAVAEKQVIILIDGEDNIGLAAILEQEVFDKAFTLGEKGYEINYDLLTQQAFFELARDKEMENIRKKLDLMWKFSRSEDNEPLWGMDNPGWRMVLNFRDQAIDAIEQLKAAPYKVVANMVEGSNITYSRNWWSWLERTFTWRESGSVVWVETRNTLNVSQNTAALVLPRAAAYAHMKIGDKLFEKSLCVFVKNKEEPGYVSLIDGKSLKNSFSRNDYTWEIDYVIMVTNAANSPASPTELEEFQEIRDTYFTGRDVTQAKINQLESRIRSKYRGFWLTAATSGGFLFEGRQLGFVEMTMARDGMGFSVSAGYREVPYETEIPDQSGELFADPVVVPFTSKELLIGAAFGFGLQNIRFDIIQLYYPYTLGLESETSGVDLVAALAEERAWGGFSAGAGVYYTLGPLYLGMSLDYLAAVFTDMPLRFNIHAGLTAKTGFRFRGDF